MSECRKKRVKAECGATARLRELRGERMEELRTGRTFNDPDVKNGMRLVLVSGLSSMATFALIAYYLAT